MSRRSARAASTATGATAVTAATAPRPREHREPREPREPRDDRWRRPRSTRPRTRASPAQPELTGAAERACGHRDHPPGGPEVLRETQRPDPVPAAGELLIRVAASGINRPDVLQRKGLYPMPPGVSDLPGLEVAGTVGRRRAGRPGRGRRRARRPRLRAGGRRRLCRALRGAGRPGACRCRRA